MSIFGFVCVFLFVHACANNSNCCALGHRALLSAHNLALQHFKSDNNYVNVSVLNEQLSLVQTFHRVMSRANLIQHFYFKLEHGNFNHSPCFFFLLLKECK